MERRRQYSRSYYERLLQRQGKLRTHGSAAAGRLHCTVDGCERTYYARGMCNMHYARVWRKANPGRQGARRVAVTMLTNAATKFTLPGVTPEIRARLRAASKTERNKAIVDAHNAGASLREIAAELELTHAGVAKILKENKP